MTTIAERIKFIRGNLSREDFALALGIHKNTVGRYERGQSEPDITIASQICLKFHVDPQWLLFGKGDSPSNSDFDARPYFYSRNDGKGKGYLLRERTEQDPIEEENTYLLTKIVENFIQDMSIPLSIEHAPALANLYYFEMRTRLAQFAEQLNNLMVKK